MTTDSLVQFADRSPVPAGSACAACGIGSMLGHDHCHEHGWVRAVACMRCNQYLGLIDRRTRPGVSDTPLVALLAVQNRCPDCPPLTAADLAPPPGRRPRRLVPSNDPQARLSRLRRLATRKGFDLMKVRGDDSYVLASKKKRTRQTLASVVAVEEFLNSR